LDDVEFDLRDGREFYDHQQAGIGDYLVDSILADAESLVLYAGVHSTHYGFFRMLGKTFPFAIYYLVDTDLVSVCAILDMRRDPSWIRAELGSRSERGGGAKRP
jgi:hypothetical protein